MAVRQILALRKAGVEEIVLNVAHLGDRIVETLGDGSAWGVRLRYSVEGRTAGEALETLGGIAKALPMLDDGDGAFIVVAGDIVTDFDYSRLVRAAALSRLGRSCAPRACAQSLLPCRRRHDAG